MGEITEIISAARTMHAMASNPGASIVHADTLRNAFGELIPRLQQVAKGLQGNQNETFAVMAVVDGKEGARYLAERPGGVSVDAMAHVRKALSNVVKDLQPLEDDAGEIPSLTREMLTDVARVVA